ncbi:MAG: shikimate kinase [Flavobacteriales bacterium]|nr:shikimate kinase [Flavobacteriales bacterium]
MRIYLMGYMGSGKSTTGKQLAKKINMDFVDIDDFIEEKEGMPIPEIFKSKGEDYFREMEHLALQELSVLENTVISLGGGTPCNEKNLLLIKETGTSIYLKMSIPALIHRLHNAKEKRPLIKGKSENDLKSYIAINLGVREDFYNRADITISGENFDIDDLELKLSYMQEI